MKDRKSLYLLIFALLVVTISFILISIWGYNFYFQPKVPQTITQEVQQPVPIAKKTSMKDSLQMLLASTVEQLGNHDSTFYDSSTDKTLELKLIEFNKLKNEIAEILKNKSSSKDMSEASEKIGQLQRSVDELRSKNDEVAKENMRLNKVLKQLIIENKSTDRKPKPVVDKVNYSGALPVLVSH
jgi:predicted metalloendopeptidase